MRELHTNTPLSKTFEREEYILIKLLVIIKEVLPSRKVSPEATPIQNRLRSIRSCQRMSGLTGSRPWRRQPAGCAPPAQITTGVPVSSSMVFATSSSVGVRLSIALERIVSKDARTITRNIPLVFPCLLETFAFILRRSSSCGMSRGEMTGARMSRLLR